MGLFTRKRPTATSAVDDAQCELEAIERNARKQEQAAEKERQRQEKQAAKERQRLKEQTEKERRNQQKEVEKRMKAALKLQKKAEKERKKAQDMIAKRVKEAEKQQKKEEKERKNAAKQELKAMKEQVKAARAEQAKEKREAKRQAATMRRLQKAQEKSRKRDARRKKKEEKKRRKLITKQAAEQLRLQEEMEQQRNELAAIRQSATAEAPGSSVVVDLEVQIAADRPLAPPKFKERLHCASCSSRFTRLPTRGRHHCRNCGDSFCGKCLSATKRPIPWFKLVKPQKVCYTCDVRVFHGMGGAASGEQTVQEVPSQRSISVSRPAESPEMDSPTASASQSPVEGPRIRLRPRSRRDAGSSKSKKNSLWTLPIRPLLKRKASAEQLRNRTWDLDLQLEKAERLARQRHDARVLDLSQPQSQLARAS